jgi:hypothetical protein
MLSLSSVTKSWSREMSLAAALSCLAFAAAYGQDTTSMIPERKPVDPEQRGQRYPAPRPGADKKAEGLWGWRCELADGSGLAFGGLNAGADDGAAHTRIKEAGQWKSIVEELRKENPLQKYHDRVWALREECKDSLAHARHIFFEGPTETQEKKFLAERVNPALQKLAAELSALIGELKGANNPGEYEAGQVQFALGKLEAAGSAFQSFTGRTSPEQLANLRRSQNGLEIAAEALDAEPAPRACSQIAYDSKTRLYALFAGTHFDYVTNDLWVFDPARRRWFQRHPATAPEPRADHSFEAAGDGRINMRGGFYQTNNADYGAKPYAHIGPARWVYDIEHNVWTPEDPKEKGFPSDQRGYRPEPGPYDPEYYMAGERPDAAANEARLNAVPVNTWVEVKPPILLCGNRDYSTAAYDPDRDMLYVYGGGHCVYSGCDVAVYHLATNRWEQGEPLEECLGGIATDWEYPEGLNFNRRPWLRCHSWNSYAYDSVSKQMVYAGVHGTTGHQGGFFCPYDPDRAEWCARRPLAGGMSNWEMDIQVRGTPHGLLAWNRDDQHLWLLDGKSLTWNKLEYKGKGILPNPCVDFSSMAYDPKRDRMLFFPGEFGRPPSCQVIALDFATHQVSKLDPEGMDASPEARTLGGRRDIAYHPDSDLFIWAVPIKGSDLLVAYDAAKNRWVTIKLNGRVSSSVSSTIFYDAKRKLLWIDEHGPRKGQAWVTRFDPDKAEIKPLKEFSPPPQNVVK